jgi:hypothetical protein
MTYRAFRGVGRTTIDLDITNRTLPPHCTYLLMIENACLGISGSTQSMRVHAPVHRQVFVHSSDRCRAIDRRRAVAQWLDKGWRAERQVTG